LPNKTLDVSPAGGAVAVGEPRPLPIEHGGDGRGPECAGETHSRTGVPDPPELIAVAERMSQKLMRRRIGVVIERGMAGADALPQGGTATPEAEERRASRRPVQRMFETMDLPSRLLLAPEVTCDSIVFSIRSSESATN